MIRRYFLCTLLILNSAALRAQFYQPKKPRLNAPEKALSALTSFREILINVCLVFGMGMVLMGIYKYVEHRRNPLSSSFGSVFAMIAIGCLLMMVQFIPFGFSG